jgi:hypothetical protein
MKALPSQRVAALAVMFISVVLGLHAVGRADPNPGSPNNPWNQGDPAAYRIDFQFVSPGASSAAGTVRIVGVVKNLASTPYQYSGYAYLFEEVPSKACWQMASAKGFQGLAPGQEFLVSFDRTWSTVPPYLPGPSPVPPRYRLVVWVDPQCKADNPANNSIIRDGADINALFKPSVQKAKSQSPLRPYLPSSVPGKPWDRYRRP